MRDQTPSASAQLAQKRLPERLWSTAGPPPRLLVAGLALLLGGLGLTVRRRLFAGTR